MKRECSQCGMSTEQWVILDRHPLDPEVAQQSVTPGFEIRIQGKPPAQELPESA